MANAIFLADIRGPKGDVGPAGPREVKTFISTDTYQSMADGVYTAVSPQAATAIGMPTESYGTLVVNYGYTGSQGLGSKLIQWFPHDGTGNVWSRTWTSAGSWSSRFTTGSKAAGAVLLAATNLSTLPDGYYTLVSNNAANTHGFPRVSQGDFIQSRGYDANNRTRLFYPSAYPTEMWVQTETNGVWGPWTQMAGGSGGGAVVGSAVERETRVVEFRNRYGGRCGTGGKAALAFVFDHGTDSFISKVLPILQKYNVPASIGLNSQMYSPDYAFFGTDASTTFASLQTAFINNGISVWNHGRLHKPTSQPMQLEIIGGRNELQISLPMIPIDGWLHTGAYGDFESGRTLAKYREQSVGALIMNGHAVLTGDIQEPIKPLNGEMKPGFDGEWLDNGATQIASAKSVIQKAQAIGGGVMTRHHPQFLGESGYISVAQLDEFIGWCAAERDAGRLVIMTGDLLNLADASSTYRRNLLSGVGGAGDQGRLISSSVYQHARGSVNEAHARVKLTTAGTVRIQVTGTGLSASKTFTVPANTWVDVRKHFMIPLIGTADLNVTCWALTGTGLQVESLNVFPG